MQLAVARSLRSANRDLQRRQHFASAELRVDDLALRVLTMVTENGSCLWEALGALTQHAALEARDARVTHARTMAWVRQMHAEPFVRHLYTQFGGDGGADALLALVERHQSCFTLHSSAFMALAGAIANELNLRIVTPVGGIRCGVLEMATNWANGGGSHSAAIRETLDRIRPALVYVGNVRAKKPLSTREDRFDHWVPLRPRCTQVGAIVYCGSVWCLSHDCLSVFFRTMCSHGGVCAQDVPPSTVAHWSSR